MSSRPPPPVFLQAIEIHACRYQKCKPENKQELIALADDKAAKTYERKIKERDPLRAIQTNERENTRKQCHQTLTQMSERSYEQQILEEERS